MQWIKTVIAVIIMVYSSCGTVQAGKPVYGNWHSCSIGGGGYVQNVVQALDNPNILYAYIDVGGLYRSEDGGQHWRMLHGALPPKDGIYQIRSLIIDPQDNQKIIIALGGHWSIWPGGIFISKDGGESFTQTLEATFGGNSPERSDGVALSRDPYNPQHVVAASQSDGVFESIDNGESWKNIGLKGCNITDIKFENIIAKSPPKEIKPGIWVCAKEGKSRVNQKMIELKGGFWYRNPETNMWEMCSKKSPSEVMEISITDKNKSQKLFALLDNRPVISNDKGRNWEKFDTGLPEVQGNKHVNASRFKAMAGKDDFIIIAATDGGVYRTSAEEAKWQKILPQSVQGIYEGRPWFKAGKDFGRSASSLVIDVRDPNHWYLTDWFAIYQTVDGGKNWKLTLNGLEDTVVHCFATDPQNPQNIYLGMADNGYFYSEDGGETFTQVDYTKGISNNIKSIAIAPAEPKRMYATGPQSWHWEANQVFISDDAGKNWRRSKMHGLPDMHKNFCNAIIVDANNKDLVFLGVSGEVKPGKGGVYQSTDGGDNWKWISHGIEGNKYFFQTSIWRSGAEIARDQMGNMLCISTSSRKVYSRPTGEGTWKELPLKLNGKPTCVISDPATNGNFYIAASGQGIIKITDNGAAWKEIFKHNVFHMAVNQSNSQQIIAGCDDGVWLSPDGGSKWQELDNNLPQRRNAYVALSGDRAYAGTDGSGAFWINIKNFH